MTTNTRVVNGHEIRPGANLRWVDLRGADLAEANLDGSDLRRADLRGANLYEADLAGADLRGANLTGANLRWADLTGADLTGANLTEAYLNGADLDRANLTGADLRGAKLNWQSHDLIAEILLRHAGDNPHRLMLAGWVLMARRKCWDYWLRIEHHEKQWALAVLDQWEGRPGR